MASLSMEDIEKLIVAVEKRCLNQRDNIEEVDGTPVWRVRLQVNPDLALLELPDPVLVTASQGRPFIPNPKYITLKVL